MTRSIVALVGVTLTTAACSSVSVNYDYDPSTNFANYRTYAWLPPRATGDPRIDSDILKSRIMAGFDKALAAKGYTKTSEYPDFLVGYHAARESKIAVDTTYDLYGYRWRRGYVTETTRVREYTRGTLILDVVDPQRQELVWRGIAEAVVSPDPDPDEIQDKIDNAAVKILETFPPGS